MPASAAVGFKTIDMLNLISNYIRGLDLSEPQRRPKRFPRISEAPTTRWMSAPCYCRTWTLVTRFLATISDLFHSYDGFRFSTEMHQ